jgi:hypothetical protein
LDAALEDLRLYTNRGIESGDFDSNIVRTEDLLEGDPVGATRTDYWAVSGDVHAQHGDSARVNRQYITGTATLETDYTSGLYFADQRVPGCSKRVVVEREAIVVITVWFMFIAGESNLSRNTIDSASQVLQYKNGTAPSNISEGFVFVEDPAIADAGAGPQPAGSAMNRRPYSFTWVETLQPGTYTYSHTVELKSEKMFVSARNMTIEVLYL